MMFWLISAFIFILLGIFLFWKFPLLVKRFILFDLLCGLSITGRYAFRKKFTIQYPEEETPISPRFKGMLALRRYENGEERCIGCRLCESVCPALAISMDVEPRSDASRRTTRFDIDAFKCINCGLCEESCPVDSIVLTSEMHYTIHERGKNILTKEKLLAIGDRYEHRLAADREEDSLYR